MTRFSPRCRGRVSYGTRRIADQAAARYPDAEVLDCAECARFHIVSTRQEDPK